MSFLLSPTLELLRNCHAAVQRGLQFRPILGGGFHSVLLPKATYSPWMGDRDFRAAYAAVEKSTLVDVYRCYELWQLVAETAKAGAGDLLEVVCGGEEPAHSSQCAAAQTERAARSASATHFQEFRRPAPPGSYL